MWGSPYRRTPHPVPDPAPARKNLAVAEVILKSKTQLTLQQPDGIRAEITTTPVAELAVHFQSHRAASNLPNPFPPLIAT